jgi:hypothetical protein
MSPAAIVLTIAFVFIALCLACALWIGRRRPPPADPFSVPFGEMPGFSAEQLRRIAPEVRNDDPLRRSFAVKNQLKRDSEPLWRLTRDSAGPSQPCGKRAAGVSSFSPRQTAVRHFFNVLRGRA